MGSAVTAMARYAGGGQVTGPGTGTSDSVPVRLSKDEFVFPADSVKAIGLKALKALVAATHKHVGMTGKSRMRRMANGGLVGDDPDQNKTLAQTVVPATSATITGATQNVRDAVSKGDYGTAVGEGIRGLAAIPLAANADLARPAQAVAGPIVSGITNAAKAVFSPAVDALSSAVPASSPAPATQPAAVAPAAATRLTAPPAYAVPKLPTAPVQAQAAPVEAPTGTPTIVKTPLDANGRPGKPLVVQGAPQAAPAPVAVDPQEAIAKGLTQQLDHSRSVMQMATEFANANGNGTRTVFNNLLHGYLAAAGQNNFGSVQQQGAAAKMANAVQLGQLGLHAREAAPKIASSELENANTRAVQDLQKQYDESQDEDQRFDIADRIALRQKASRQQRATVVPLGVNELGQSLGSAVYSNKSGKVTYPREDLGVNPTPLPPGMVKQVGTSGGKPVYEDKNGKRFMGG